MKIEKGAYLVLHKLSGTVVERGFAFGFGFRTAAEVGTWVERNCLDMYCMNREE